MANRASVEKNLQGTLQRGKACLRCRKRKMRCDGVKPACQQCVRAKKGDGCEYDDGKGKTRTQILRETIARLEHRVRELEDPDYVSPAVILHDPHSCSDSSHSSFGSPRSPYLSASHSPFLTDSPSSPPEVWIHSQTLPSPSPSPFLPDMFFDSPQVGLQIPFELGQMLIDILAPHLQQCGLQLDMGKLRDSLGLPVSEQRHPVLLNAVYLWACFVSRPEPLCEHESHYLRSSLEALPKALDTSDNIIDVIQASCLLSTYFFANGRLTEGNYHASAAAALAMQNGIHKGSMYQSTSWNLMNAVDGYDNKPLKRDVRGASHIQAFWQVYNLDRCWSVVLQRPCMITDGSDSWNSIFCPWPQEQETNILDSYPTAQTIRTFLEGDCSPSGFSIPALRVKASTLFSQADLLAKGWDSSTKIGTRLSDARQNMDHAINLFLTTLIHVNQLDSILPEDKHSLIVVHALVQAAVINLHRSGALKDQISFEKCSQAARSCVALIKHINEQDYGFLDPIFVPCLCIAAEILISELETLEASWPLVDSSNVRNELSVILYALTRLSTRYPIAASAFAKLQKRLV